MKWVNPNIFVFRDMNESKDSQVTKLKRVWKLASPHKKNNQRTKCAWKTEGIDTWLFYVKQRNNLIRIEQRGNSDHYPLMIDFKILRTNKIRRIYTHWNSNRQQTQDHLIKL